MDKSVETLLTLQDKDMRLFNLNKQIESVPEEKIKIAALLTGAETTVKAAKGKCLEIENKIKSVEIEIATVNEKIRALQSKSAAVKKNEEYRALLNEAEGWKQKISEFEDQQLKLWEELEAAKQLRHKEEKSLEATQARVKAAIEDLETRGRNCKEQIEKVAADRALLAGAVPAELLRLYERLLQRPSQRKVFQKILVPIESENCGGCCLKVTPQVRTLVRRGQPVPCENCGALIYYPF